MQGRKIYYSLYLLSRYWSDCFVTAYFFIFVFIFIYFFNCCRLMFQHLLCSYHNDIKSGILFGDSSFNTLLSRAQNLGVPYILTFLCCFQFSKILTLIVTRGFCINPTFLCNFQTLIFKLFFFSSLTSICTFLDLHDIDLQLTSPTEFVNFVLNS